MGTLKEHAKFVLDLLNAGHYTVDGRAVSIETAQRHACGASRLFTPEGLATLRETAQSGSPVVRVVNATSQQAAREMANAGPVMLLNFASARNPGGGFLNGAKAQEEDLCRCSGLYPTLLEHPTYYRVNRAQRSMIYTDHAIYSPEVPFFKTSGSGPLLAHPFLASIVTAPAPNTAPHLARNPGDEATLDAAFEQRWRNILAIARDTGHRRLLLGAWGCGAFGGNPVMVANAAKRALAIDSAHLDEVVFAIPGRGRVSAQNLEAFRIALVG